MKFKDYYGKEACDDLRKRLEEAFESEDSVFILIGTVNEKTGVRKVSDAYMAICPDCVLDAVNFTVKDAAKKGLLSPHGRFNLN